MMTKKNGNESEGRGQLTIVVCCDGSVEARIYRGVRTHDATEEMYEVCAVSDKLSTLQDILDEELMVSHQTA